jgi:hypothetical protein
LHSKHLVYALWIASAGLSLSLSGQDFPAAGLAAFPEVNLSALSQPDDNPLGAQALAIRSQDWKHGETEHFIYHFVHSYVATPISVEAEFHFRVIAQQLGLETMPGGSAKSHIYIFENAQDWKSFQSQARLEPWTGGIHSHGSLFIVRDPAYRFANNSLGHEIAHLVLFRAYGRPLPLWLEEGFAEYVSRVTRASYQRARNYNARPYSDSIGGEQLIPLAQLIALREYPQREQIETFYNESERLVRFLVSIDSAGFRGFLDAIAQGESFDTALSRHYAGRFVDVAALDKEFFPYASKDAVASGLAP